LIGTHHSGELDPSKKKPPHWFREHMVEKKSGDKPVMINDFSVFA
jgi:hypothetical protein